MRTSRHILNVFLASPSDVEAERAAAEEVVNSINQIIGRQLRWQIDLLKWEDVTPGFGRPQEIINPMVDSCDLFIGLLWKWWGQPTGRYSSGFEEEFERAKARRHVHGQPEIWLFFKTVDPETIKDFGPQLTRVLEFRKSQIALREVLFNDIRDTLEWKTRLYNWLWEHVLKLALNREESQPTEVAPAVGSPNAGDVSPDTSGKEEVAQLKNVSWLLGRVIESGKLEFSVQEAKLLQEFEVARLFLLSSTLMSRRYTGDVLSTHELNLLYKHRENLEVTSAEQF
jgi:Domain of unknown function (DUF4062)